MDDIEDFIEPVVLVSLPFQLVPDVVEAVARRTHDIMLKLKRAREAANPAQSAPSAEAESAAESASTTVEHFQV